MVNITTPESKKVNLQTIILLSVILMFLSDIVNTILDKAGINLAYNSFSVFVRLVVGIFFIFLILRKNKGKKVFLIILSLISFYLIGLSSNVIFLEEPFNLLLSFRNIVLVSKLTFIFLCFEVVIEYFYEHTFQLRLFQIFEIIILVSSLAVLIGFIFKIELFSSYGLGSRGGYKGLFPAQNEASGFFILATLYYLNKVFQISKNNINFLGLTLAIAAGLLTGTKVCLVFIPVCVFCYFLKYFNLHFFLKKIYIFEFITILVVLFLLLNAGSLLEQWSKSVGYFRGQYLSIRDTGKEEFSIWSQLLFSSRNIKVGHFFIEIFKKWNFLNFLFGGWSLVTFSTETDPVDIFALVGLIGFIIYYINYIRILGISIKLKFFQNFPLIILLIISFLGGHFSFSAINAMYLSIFLLQTRLIKKMDSFSIEIVV